MADFYFCKHLTTIPDKNIYVSDLPNEGDFVYQGRTPIRLTKKLGDGGEGIVYKTNKSENVVAKIYFGNKLTSHRQAKIDKIIAAGLSIEGVCFPTEHLYNSKGVFIGYLMPKAEGEKLGTSVFRGEKGMKKFFGNWSRSDLVTLAVTILSTIKNIHDLGILIGDINGLNILVKSPTKVYFVDTDSFQINEYPCPVGTLDFTAPEIQGKDYKYFLRSIGNENFAIAVLLFKLLMFGESPYAQQGGAGIAHGARLLDDTKSGVWRVVGGCVLLCTGLKNLKNEKNRYEKICNFKQNIPTIQKQLSDLDLIICEYLNLLNKVYDVYKKYLDIMKKVIIDEDRIDWNMYTDFEKMIFLKVFLLVQLFVDVCRVRFVQEPEQGQFIGTINREEIDKAILKMNDVLSYCVI